MDKLETEFKMSRQRAEDILGTQLADDSTIRAAVGVSLMWNSPVGPLRIDYAEPISKENYDQEQKFRFGASTKF